MKRKLTFAMLVFNLIELVMMFMPVIFKEWIWFLNSSSSSSIPAGSYTQSTYESTNYFGGVAFPDFLEILSIISFILFVISFVCILIFLLCNKKKTEFLLYSPVVTFAIMMVYSLMVSDAEISFSKKSFYSWEFNWGYYILVGINILSIILMLIIKLDKSDDSNETQCKKVSQSNADELKKYKDLLDSGVITQEEFDAKKKQLLGL